MIELNPQTVCFIIDKARGAEYLITTPLVADYLEEGLNQHGYTCG